MENRTNIGLAERCGAPAANRTAYEAPEVTVIALSSEDILTDSSDWVVNNENDE